jgi:hypothetical protein
MHARIVNALVATAALTACALTTAAPSQAAGCGGYVNAFVAGCAPWDNNPRRMPGAPGYQAPRPTASPAISQNVRAGIVSNNQNIRAGVVNNARGGIVAGGAGNLISPGNRTGIVAGGAGNLISPGNRTGIVAGGAGNLISPGNRNPGLIANDGTSFRR